MQWKPLLLFICIYSILWERYRGVPDLHKLGGNRKSWCSAGNEIDVNCKRGLPPWPVFVLKSDQMSLPEMSSWTSFTALDSPPPTPRVILSGNPTMFYLLTYSLAASLTAYNIIWNAWWSYIFKSCVTQYLEVCLACNNCAFVVDVVFLFLMNKRQLSKVGLFWMANYLHPFIRKLVSLNVCGVRVQVGKFEDKHI